MEDDANFDKYAGFPSLPDKRVPRKPTSTCWRSDLQILKSSLIITNLFGDAARFCCGDSCFEFSLTVDRILIVQ